MIFSLRQRMPLFLYHITPRNRRLITSHYGLTIVEEMACFPNSCLTLLNLTGTSAKQIKQSFETISFLPGFPGSYILLLPNEKLLILGGLIFFSESLPL
jgi:hypothetical protein